MNSQDSIASLNLIMFTSFSMIFFLYLFIAFVQTNQYYAMCMLLGMYDHLVFVLSISFFKKTHFLGFL